MKQNNNTAVVWALCIGLLFVFLLSLAGSEKRKADNLMEWYEQQSQEFR